MRTVVVVIEHDVRRLAIVDCPEPQPGPGELLVAVKAISLNRGEVSQALTSAPGGYRPGWDYAGVVLAAAAGSGFEPGQRVVGLVLEGGWA